MTKEQRTGMWRVGIAAVLLLLAVAGVVYAAGGKGRDIEVVKSDVVMLEIAHKADVSGLHDKFNRLDRELGETATQVQGMKDQMDGRFDRLEGKIDKLLRK